MDDYKSLISGFISGGLHTIIGYPLDTLKTLKQSNIKFKNQNLFRGLLYPLIQTSLLNSVSFGSNNYLKKFNDNHTSNLFTGFISSVISTPLDKYKIMSQYNLKYNLNFINIIKSYNKFHIVLYRELPATYIYFSSYEICKKNNINTFLSGSIAGVNSWLFTYPIDTIKTRLQSNKYNNISNALKRGNLFYGLRFCLFRAFIVNGINFTIYEYCYQNL